MKRYKFRFRGVTRIRDGEPIIFFFLDEPQILVGKDKRRLEEADTTGSLAKYIPYKESDGGGEKCGKTSSVAYPENWREDFGVSYKIKEKRNSVIDIVSAQDIRNRGRKVINPFIGEIPTMDELEDELEELYMSM